MQGYGGWQRMSHNPRCRRQDFARERDCSPSSPILKGLMGLLLWTSSQTKQRSLLNITPQQFNRRSSSTPSQQHQLDEGLKPSCTMGMQVLMKLVKINTGLCWWQWHPFNWASTLTSPPCSFQFFPKIKSKLFGRSFARIQDLAKVVNSELRVSSRWSTVERMRLMGITLKECDWNMSDSRCIKKK